MSLVFVDVEASGPCPGRGELTEFGAVMHKTKETFYGDLRNKTPWGIAFVFDCFNEWLETNCDSRPIFVSDNPAFDWQWINYYFHHYMGKNPFGWSGRRIGDYFAGLQGDFRKSCSWKKLRVTKHDHNPVNDAMGNVEAFDAMQLNYLVEKDKTRKAVPKRIMDVPVVDIPIDYSFPNSTGDYNCGDYEVIL